MIKFLKKLLGLGPTEVAAQPEVKVEVATPVETAPVPKVVKLRQPGAPKAPAAKKPATKKPAAKKPAAKKSAKKPAPKAE